eukprot:1885019-Prymnesium_polylepis.1
MMWRAQTTDLYANCYLLQQRRVTTAERSRPAVCRPVFLHGTFLRCDDVDRDCDLVGLQEQGRDGHCHHRVPPLVGVFGGGVCAIRSWRNQREGRGGSAAR